MDDVHFLSVCVGGPAVTADPESTRISRIHRFLRRRETFTNQVVMLNSVHGADRVWRVRTENSALGKLNGLTNVPSQGVQQITVSWAREETTK